MRRVRTIAAVLGVALALTACGSAADTPSPAPTTTASTPDPLARAAATLASYPQLGSSRASAGGQAVRVGALGVEVPAGFTDSPEYALEDRAAVWIGPEVPGSKSADGTSTSLMSVTVKVPVEGTWDGVIDGTSTSATAITSRYAFTVPGAQLAGVAITEDSEHAAADSTGEEKVAAQTGPMSTATITVLADGMRYELIVDTAPGAAGLEVVRQLAASLSVAS